MSGASSHIILASKGMVLCHLHRSSGRVFLVEPEHLAEDIPSLALHQPRATRGGLCLLGGLEHVTHELLAEDAWEWSVGCYADCLGEMLDLALFPSFLSPGTDTWMVQVISSGMPSVLLPPVN